MPSSWKFWSKPASRLFIYNIHMKSNKYANWDPAFPIELGDYGIVDKDTGMFKKYGSIFKDGKTDTSKMTRTTGATDDVYNICSAGVNEVAFDVKPTIEFPGIANASIKAQFNVRRGRGAILLQEKPTTSKLEGPFEDIIRDGAGDHLRGMQLVTEVVECPAYAMYLSVKASETVRIVLSGSSPVAIAAGLNVGGDLGGRWYHEGNSSIFRSGSQHGKRYTTLYYTMSIGKKGNLRRDLKNRDPATVGQECWVPSPLPWKMLDENGNGSDDDDEDLVEESDEESDDSSEEDK